MFDEHVFEKGVIMSAQLSFDLEELAQKRVVGLGEFRLAQRSTIKPKRPHLQLVDATYIERALAKSRHPAGSKMPCPPAVGRENRTEGAGDAFDSLPQWVRRAPRLTNVVNTASTRVAAVPPVATVTQRSKVGHSAHQKSSVSTCAISRVGRKISQVSLAILMAVGALLTGVGIGSYWDSTAGGDREINQPTEELAIESGHASSADLFLGSN